MKSIFKNSFLILADVREEKCLLRGFNFEYNFEYTIHVYNVIFHFRRQRHFRRNDVIFRSSVPILFFLKHLGRNNKMNMTILRQEI